MQIYYNSELNWTSGADSVRDIWACFATREEDIPTCAVGIQLAVNGRATLNKRQINSTVAQKS